VAPVNIMERKKLEEFFGIFKPMAKAKYANRTHLVRTLT